MRLKKREKEILRRERLEPEVSGGLEGAWPPKWMTTYSDMVTLLMTFFVLWYALTIMRIDPELIVFREEESPELVSGVAEEREILRVSITEEMEIWREIERMTPEQLLALSDIRTLRELAEEVKDYLEKGEIDEVVQIKVVGEDVVIIPTSNVLFPEGSDEMSPEFHPILDRIAWLIERTGASVRIEGHTCSTPIHPHRRLQIPSNWELSTRRATATARYLIDRHRISPRQVSVAGYGPLRPVAPNIDREGRERNRRVEFHLFITSET